MDLFLFTAPRNANCSLFGEIDISPSFPGVLIIFLGLPLGAFTKYIELSKYSRSTLTFSEA
ncbi:MAG: hypothetical protein Ct9H90mP7_2230 [Candidatus Neomarinimicrobiota bacterium]|nr:MAG: hypothetical protein Ct9H90mP7_2230 [Candidatus Neomarinimicrobiota bacterium]